MSDDSPENRPLPVLRAMLAAIDGAGKMDFSHTRFPDLVENGGHPASFGLPCRDAGKKFNIAFRGADGRIARKNGIGMSAQLRHINNIGAGRTKQRLKTPMLIECCFPVGARENIVRL